MKLALPALIGAAGLLAALAGQALSAPPPPATQPTTSGCFRTQDIRNHTIGDRHTLYVRIDNGDVFKLGMAGSCLAGAGSSDPLIMRSPPGTAIACRAVDLDISISRGGLATGIPAPCIVNSMVKLTPAEVTALPKKLVP